MKTATEHYEAHLGPIYSWMVGDLEAASARAANELDALGIAARANGTAVDLGAGFGLHALPLARRGYAVTAIDSCQTLLDELRLRTKELPVTALAANLSDFTKWVAGPVDVILCMGDTLTHLPDYSGVERLVSDVARSLAPGGIFATTFRDYVSTPLQGDRRFIPVRSDADRILTCFLEYAEDIVTVHDLLHEREHGQWRLRVSSYPKLRLHPERVAAKLTAQGLTTRVGAATAGMVSVVATRP